MSDEKPPLDAEVACANCGRAFRGEWCPTCGQRDADLDRPVRQFLHHVLGEVLAFDARIWRTLGPLVTRPGFLASDYVAGRRARYVPPFRLYVFLGAAFFTALALSGGGPMRFATVTRGDTVEIVSAFGIQMAAEGISAGADGTAASGFVRAAGEVDRLNAVVVATLSYVHLLLLPVLALYLTALWRRRWYLEHLVFATYFGAFALLAGTVMVGAYALAGNPSTGGSAARTAILGWELVVVAMLYRALRDMYGDGRWKTLGKTVALSLAYFLTLGIAVAAIAMGTIVLVY